MRKLIFTLCCLLSITLSRAQTNVTISSGTNVLNTGATYNISGASGAANTFVNNGSYTDTTASGQFNVDGPFTFSGTGTTVTYNFNINSGLSLLSSQVSVYNTATIGSGDSLNANGKLYLRTDIKAGANLVNNGYLIGNVLGIVTNATATCSCLRPPLVDIFGGWGIGFLYGNG